MAIQKEIKVGILRKSNGNPHETQMWSTRASNGKPRGINWEYHRNPMGTIRKPQAETYGNPMGIARMPNGIATDIDCKSNVPKEANCGIRLRANESRSGIARIPTRTQLKSNCAQNYETHAIPFSKTYGNQMGTAGDVA